MKIALGIRYEGTHYHGWQNQKRITETIQAQLECALSKVANRAVQLVCAGRTDKGVHAIEQIAHFKTDAIRTNHSWVMGANKYLPKDITVYWATQVDNEFHARFSAISRHYRYILYTQPIRPTLLRNHVGWYYKSLKVLPMQEALAHLLGEHDFQHFRSKDCQAKTSTRTISNIKLLEKRPFIIFDIQANAFLHNMVRNIIGALLEVGVGKKEANWLKFLVDNPKETLTEGLNTVSPQGLYLVQVFYPDSFKLPQSIDLNSFLTI